MFSYFQHRQSNDSHLKHYKATQLNEHMSSVLGIQFTVAHRHFAQGRLQVKLLHSFNFPQND